MPRALRENQCGKVNSTAFALPAFLWAGDPPGQDYDDNNMFEGIFNGYLLEWTMRHIFTSPSSAYGGEMHATHTCITALHNMTTVEAAHIAYGCLQNTWSEIDVAFNYREFYNNIIELIKDSPDPEWKGDLLKAWNVQGNPNTSSFYLQTNSSSTLRANSTSTLRVNSSPTLQANSTSTSQPCESTPAPPHEPTSPPPREPTPPPPRKPTPPPPHEPTPPPPCDLPTLPPPRKPTPPPPREPTPTPPPPAPQPKPKPAVPACAESHVPSDLTEAESCEDFEPVQIATKRKAKKAGGHSTKRKASAPIPAQKSLRK
ncbi:hypothetical protein BD769DRAFT_1387895 [Suillus cothurnatus]|nr:hypothetical protein BD769DRAFT_1387895 [Suillus cothurnatus]